MQALIKMDNIVIDDYYRIRTMDENMDWMKLSSIVIFFSKA